MIRKYNGLNRQLMKENQTQQKLKKIKTLLKQLKEFNYGDKIEIIQQFAHQHQADD